MQDVFFFWRNTRKAEGIRIGANFRAKDAKDSAVSFDDTLRLVAMERIEMMADNQPRPYVRQKVGLQPPCNISNRN